jgi:hypothetical protein
MTSCEEQGKEGRTRSSERMFVEDSRGEGGEGKKGKTDLEEDTVVSGNLVVLVSEEGELEVRSEATLRSGKLQSIRRSSINNTRKSRASQSVPSEQSTEEREGKAGRKKKAGRKGQGERKKADIHLTKRDGRTPSRSRHRGARC